MKRAAHVLCTRQSVATRAATGTRAPRRGERTMYDVSGELRLCAALHTLCICRLLSERPGFIGHGAARQPGLLPHSSARTLDEHAHAPAEFGYHPPSARDAHASTVGVMPA